MTASDSLRGPADWRIAIVASSYDPEITDRLVAGAHGRLVEAGILPEAIDVVQVPGAFELPLAVKWVIEAGNVHGVVALGCVIRGETPHFEFVSLGATVGLEATSREHGIPVAFGVLTTENGEQARARAGGAKGNKGREAADAVLRMCRLRDRLSGASS